MHVVGFFQLGGAKFGFWFAHNCGISFASKPKWEYDEERNDGVRGKVLSHEELHVVGRGTTSKLSLPRSLFFLSGI